MSIDQRAQWLLDARFGLFIHWGLYSTLAGEWQGQRMDYIGEWIMSRFRIPGAEYSKLAAQFNPQGFNADEWVQLAKQAGMRYSSSPRSITRGLPCFIRNAIPTTSLMQHRSVAIQSKNWPRRARAPASSSACITRRTSIGTSLMEATPDQVFQATPG